MIKKLKNIHLSLSNKMILFFVLISIVVLGVNMIYIVVKQEDNMLLNVKEKANLTLEKYATRITTVIEKDFNIDRGVLYSILAFEKLDYKARNDFVMKTTQTALENNPNYVSFWIHFELDAVDTNFVNKKLRKRYTSYRDGFGKITFRTDTLSTDINKLNPNNVYLKLKYYKIETMLEPYWDSYTDTKEDEILVTSIVVPIVKNDTMLGIIGSDIKLEFFKNWFDQINTQKGIYMFLMSNEGTIISYPESQLIGKNISQVMPFLNVKYALSTYIKAGNKSNFEGTDPISKTKGYFWIKPIQLGKSNNPWSIGIFVSKEIIVKDISDTVLKSILFILIGIIIILIGIGVLVQKQVSKPLKKTIQTLNQLAEGNMSIEKIKIKRNDEIRDMAKAVNLLMDRLNETTSFAKEIKKGNFDIKYEKTNKDDIIGESLLNMRKNLVKAKKEGDEYREKEDIRNWITEGNAKFGEILRKYNNNINELSFNILDYLVKYLDCIQGSLFVKKIKDKKEVVFEMTGSIAYGRYKNDKKEFYLKENLVGRCAFEEITIYMEDVPENYVDVTSGLDKKNPQTILIVPAILNKETYAVIELISFNKLQKYQIELIESISEGIASTIANVKTNEKTHKLLEQSKYQSEELASQEEEIRQNLEELQATQEEAQRLRKEENKKIEEAEKQKKALEMVINQMPCRIFLKDYDGRIIVANSRTAEILNMEMDNLVDRLESEILDDQEAARIILEDDKRIINNDETVTKIHGDYFFNENKMIETTKIPFFINHLQQKGILYVQVNIDEIKNMEKQIADLKEQLAQLQQ